MEMEEISKNLKEMEEAEGFSKVELHARFELLQEERLKLSPGEYVDAYEELLRWECELAREEERKKNPYYTYDKIREVRDFLKKSVVCASDAKKIYELALKEPFLIVWDICSSRIGDCTILIFETAGASFSVCELKHLLIFSNEIFKPPLIHFNALIYHELAHFLLKHKSNSERQEQEANSLSGKWSME